jgi:ATP-dependent DNA ligase
MITKPMLAGKCSDIEKLKYPVLATPKLDGIRCLVINGKAVSRKFKPIPNDYIRSMIEMTCNSMELDGEILIPGKTFNELSGDVRRIDGRPTTFEYHVFDRVNQFLSTPYWHRMQELDALRRYFPAFVKLVLPRQFSDAVNLARYEQEMIEAGYEGIMVRSPNSPYKCGRSTENEGYLLKIKRFEDSEAEIVHVYEEQENQNEAKKDAFGRTERSSCQANKVGKGTLGGFELRSDLWPETFSVGTGFTASDRLRLWQDYQRDCAAFKGRIVKFKHQPSGAKDRPRFPVFLGFRDEWDT